MSITEYEGEDVFVMYPAGNGAIHEPLGAILTSRFDDAVSHYVAFTEPFAHNQDNTAIYFQDNKVYYIKECVLEEDSTSPSMQTVVVPCSIGYDLIEIPEED